MPKQRVGVFDSGIGGQSVAEAITRSLPEVEIMFVNDSKNVPYGSKTPEQLLALVLPILQNLAKKTDVIVVACNSVSTTIITDLRHHISVPLIAMEPMIKPAAEQTENGIIAVCATPTTLTSQRYQWLKDEYSKAIKVLEPDCSDWSSMLEAHQLDHQKISQRINEVCSKGADVIVLGCTHYHWIEADIRTIAAAHGAKVVQPEQAVIRQLKRVLKQLS